MPWHRTVTLLLQKNAALQVISAATNGLEAVTKAQELQPDLVLLDIGLPDIDGVVLGAALRKDMPELPIIFCTGHGDRRTALHDANTRFLQKPFTVDELLAEIASLDQARLQ